MTTIHKIVFVANRYLLFAYNRSWPSGRRLRLVGDYETKGEAEQRLGRELGTCTGSAFQIPELSGVRSVQ
jgi:hypothetical protein